MRFPVVLILQPSRRLVVLLFALHGVIAAAFLLAALSWPLVVPAWFILFVSLTYALLAERAKTAARLTLDHDARLGLEWPITNKNNDEGDGRVRGIAIPTGCVDFGWAVWLRWSSCEEAPLSAAKRRGALMLLPDHVGHENWRILRIWLRHCCVGNNG